MKIKYNLLKNKKKDIFSILLFVNFCIFLFQFFLEDRLLFCLILRVEAQSLQIFTSECNFQYYK